jgi:hypothetical protein
LHLSLIDKNPVETTNTQKTKEATQMFSMFSLGILELLIILGFFGAMAVGAILLVASAVRHSGRSQPGNPNLQPCPDCGRLISIRATTCPHCGGPAKGLG